MSGHVSTGALMKVLKKRDTGEITDAMIDAFANDPHKILRQYPIASEREEKIGLIPKDGRADGFVLAGRIPFYVHSPGSGKDNLLYAGKEISARHRTIVGLLQFGRGALNYIFQDGYHEWRLSSDGKETEVISDLNHCPRVVISALGLPFYVGSVKGTWLVRHGETTLAHEKEPISEAHLTQKGVLTYVVGDPEGKKGQRIVVEHKFLRHDLSYSSHSVRSIRLLSDGRLFYVEAYDPPKGRAMIDSHSEPLVNFREFHGVAEDSVTGEVVCWGNIGSEDHIHACVARMDGSIREYPEYRWMESLTLVGGEILAVGFTNGNGDCVIWRGEEEEHFQTIERESLSLAKGIPLYVVSREDKQFVVWDRHEGGLYDEIFSLHVEGDLIVYGARNGRKLFRVERPMTAAA